MFNSVCTGVLKLNSLCTAFQKFVNYFTLVKSIDHNGDRSHFFLLKALINVILLLNNIFKLLFINT